jgi:ATP/maltotriose-dependent transcriptional regulator MalT/DNA-binding SARP family transcriptional activator
MIFRPASERKLDMGDAPPNTAISRAVARPQLQRRLAELLERRVGLIVADAGFGKSTLAALWSQRVVVAWHHCCSEDQELETFSRAIMRALRGAVSDLPEDLTQGRSSVGGPDASTEEAMRASAFAALLVAALDARLDEHLVLVLDDAHELVAGSSSWRLIENLCRQSGRLLHVLVLSRTEPPLELERLRGRGEVLSLTGRDLAFTVGEVCALLRETLGDVDDVLAADLHRITGGWPAAVCLARETLRSVPASERPQIVGRLRRRGSPVFTYLAREVFDALPEDVRRLLRLAARVDRLSPALCEVLGVRISGERLESCVRRGLFVEHDRAEPGWFKLSELARDFVCEHYPLSAQELRDAHRRAADWFERHGRCAEALRLLVASGDDVAIVRLLTVHGEALLSQGEVSALLRATDVLPAAARDATIEKLAGQAHLIRGEFERALGCLQRASTGDEQLEAGVAWRMGLIHHLRGELDQAEAIYRRGRRDGSQERDVALLLAWSATVDWLRGAVDASRAHSEEAFRVASASGDPHALAAAHNALAMLAALEGDRVANRMHYVRALENAERAGDVLQIIRIRNNRGSHYSEEGDYVAALEDLEICLDLADVAGFAHFRALALCNRGHTRFCLGRLEEAISDLHESRVLYTRIGSRNVTYPLALLAEVHRERGDLVLARAEYEEAIAHARRSGDVQGLGYAMSGLAIVLAGEPQTAALIDEALACGDGMSRVRTLNAAASVALERGDGAQAAELAADAASIARARRDRNGLAEALELWARAAPGDVARERLEQAISIFRALGNPVAEARAQVSLGPLLEAPRGQSLVAGAERRLRDLGAHGHAAAAAGVLAELKQRARPPVRVESLGRFRVLRDGVPVPANEWQSRKARELLKLLVLRRGRPVTRDAIMEALWPGGDPAKLSNRLSVALSTIRAVLDPGRRFEPAAFIASSSDTVTLELGALELDVELFFAAADAGLALLRAGHADAARERLVAAEAMYAGDFLEEDAYEDWAAPVREEARAAYLEIAHALAEDAAEQDDPQAAQRYLLRALEKDPFDERAHLALVAALSASGRHGDARRAYRGYAARMHQLDVEPAPFEPRHHAAARVAGAAAAS